MVDVTATMLTNAANYSGLDNSIVESIVDAIIDFLNLEVGVSIPLFRDAAGVAGSKTITLTASQNVVVVPAAMMVVRTNQDRRPNAVVGAMSVTTLTSESAVSVCHAMVEPCDNSVAWKKVLEGITMMEAARQLAEYDVDYG
jgi:hypothetical protein